MKRGTKRKGKVWPFRGNGGTGRTRVGSMPVFWGIGPCLALRQGEQGRTRRTYALLSGHFPQSADEGNHPDEARGIPPPSPLSLILSLSLRPLSSPTSLLSSLRPRPFVPLRAALPSVCYERENLSETRMHHLHWRIFENFHRIWLLGHWPQFCNFETVSKLLSKLVGLYYRENRFLNREKERGNFKILFQYYLIILKIIKMRWK